jgi:hypothetical protein
MSTQTTSSARLTYRVLPVNGLWKVTLPGDSVPDSFHVRKEEAIASAMRLAKRDGAGVLVMRADGSVEAQLSEAGPR